MTDNTHVALVAGYLKKAEKHGASTRNLIQSASNHAHDMQFAIGALREELGAGVAVMTLGDSLKREYNRGYDSGFAAARLQMMAAANELDTSHD